MGAIYIPAGYISILGGAARVFRDNHVITFAAAVLALSVAKSSMFISFTCVSIPTNMFSFQFLSHSMNIKVVIF